MRWTVAVVRCAGRLVYELGSKATLWKHQVARALSGPGLLQAKKLIAPKDAHVLGTNNLRQQAWVGKL
jgi:hypothetical protein